MLRAALLAIGCVMVGAGVAVALAGCGPGLALRLAVPGLLLAAAILAERWRYRRPGSPGRGSSGPSSSSPGAGWTATQECFLDPESGRLVRVYYRPATGERSYRAIEAPPPPAVDPRERRSGR